MFNPFDVVAKELLRSDTRGWLRFLGVDTTGAVELIEADLTAVTADADEVIRVDDPGGRFLVHLEFQSSYDVKLPIRLLRYNALLDHRHEPPVRTVLILFRPQADMPSLTGTLRRTLPNGRVYLEFQYEIVRVWQRSVEEFLNGSPALLPLAPLAHDAAGDLRELGLRINDRLEREVSPETANVLWTSTYILAGMRLSESQVNFMKGLRNMRESVTYQAILREGREEGIKEARIEGEVNLIVFVGTKRFGDPDPLVMTTLKEIAELDRLKRISERLFDAESWEDLVQTP